MVAHGQEDNNHTAASSYVLLINTRKEIYWYLTKLQAVSKSVYREQPRVFAVLGLKVVRKIPTPGCCDNTIPRA